MDLGTDFAASSKDHVELLMIDAPLDAKLLLSLPEVLRVIGMGRSWTLLAAKEGRFPKPLAIGRARRWLAADIQQWVLNQAAKGAVDA